MEFRRKTEVGSAPARHVLYLEYKRPASRLHLKYNGDGSAARPHRPRAGQQRGRRILNCFSRLTSVPREIPSSSAARF